jgi:hypothetical protein
MHEKLDENALIPSVPKRKLPRFVQSNQKPLFF